MQQIGPYQVRSKLGEGQMARVYLVAESPNTPREQLYALKVLKNDMTPKDAAALEREAQVLKRLDSDFIVHVYRYQKIEQGVDTVHCILMEYVPGSNLYWEIQDKKQLSPANVIRIAWQVCKALEHAHAKEIIHRDIKPQNIIVQKGNLIKVCDFGIAVIASTSLSSMSHVQGTPYYLSPEQARGEQGDPRSDIYSLGVVMYHMLAGEPPFGGIDPSVVLDKQRNEEPARIETKRSGTPVDLARVVHKALEKNPKARFQTATEMAERLESLAVQRGILLPEMPQPSRMAAFRAIFLDWDIRRIRDTLTNLGASAIQWVMGLVLVGVLAVLGWNSYAGGNSLDGGTPTSAPNQGPTSAAIVPTSAPTVTPTRTPEPTNTPTPKPTSTNTPTPSITPSPTHTPEPPTATTPPPTPTPLPVQGADLGDSNISVVLADYRFLPANDSNDGAIWLKMVVTNWTDQTMQLSYDLLSFTGVDDQGTQYGEYYYEVNKRQQTAPFCAPLGGGGVSISPDFTLSAGASDVSDSSTYQGRFVYLTKDRTYNHRVEGGCELKYKVDINVNWIDVTLPQIKYRVNNGKLVTLSNIKWHLLRK